MGQISTAAQFLNGLGVNVHVEYTDGKYASASNVIDDLSYLGITHVRDAVLNPSNQGQYNYETLASSGIKFDFFYQGVDLSSTMDLVDAFVSRHPGSVSLIEGPNEVNNFPISYAGLTGNAAALSYQADLYAAVHSDNSLAGIQVANLTSWPDLVGLSDLANYHPYPRGGVTPGAVLLEAGQEEIAAQGGRPLVMTEGGYNTLVSSSNSDGVDELTQAKYILDIFLDNARNGVSSSFVYELLDAYADPSNTDPEKHYGLFHLDNTPKIAATAIHNLTTILSAGSDDSIASSPLTFSTPGLSTTASTLILTKATGVHDLVLWNEPTIWDAINQQEVAASSTPVTIHLGALSDVTVYDPLSSSAAVQTFYNVQDVTVSISDHPMIVEVRDLSRSAPVASPPVTVTLANGSIQTTTVNADGTTLKHVTGITGQAYVTSDSVYSAANVLTSVNRFDNAGTTVESDTYKADGSYVAHVLAPSGAAYARTDQTYTAAGILTSKMLYDAAGKLLETDTYNTDGSFTAHVLNQSNSSAMDYVYNASGGLIMETIYGTGGQTEATYRYNADGSYSAHLLNSPAYASIDYTVGTTGKIINQTAHAFGGQTLSWTYLYAPDGSVSQYATDSASTSSQVKYVSDASGKVTEVYTNYADGSYSAHLLDNSAYAVVDYTVDASGKLINQTAHEFDGNAVSWTYTYSADGSVTQHYVDSSSAYAAVDYVLDSAGTLDAVYAQNFDGSYSAHIVNDPNYAAIDYTVGTSGKMQVETTTALDGAETVQLFVNGASVTNTIADEVFKLLGTSQQLNLGANFGHAIVYDFTLGSDVLTVASVFSGELASALTHAVNDGHGDTLVTLDGNNSILLMGVTSASVQMHLADFHLAA